MVHHGSELSFVSDVKTKQLHEPMLTELRKAVLKKSLEAFSQGRYGIFLLSTLFMFFKCR